MTIAEAPLLSESASAERSQRWRWMVCGTLFLALFLNYADRAVFTQNAKHIKAEFQITDKGYGELTGAFAQGFAWGGLIFGIVADKLSVRYLYPVVVLVWSIAGISRGFVGTMNGLMMSQVVLGFFEAGHWPCALRTTQRVLSPSERTLGNSILQSGASVGSIAIPLFILTIELWDPTQWRLAFYVAGGLGLPWVLVWLASIKERDLQQPVLQTDDSTGTNGAREFQEMPFWSLFLTSRWWLLVLIVISINTVWHYIREWLPIILDSYGYSAKFVQYFTSLYYLATFVGSIAAGQLTLYLAQRGWNVQRARLAVFLLCSLLTALSVPAATLPAGSLLLACLLLIGAGSLGLFPIYYSLNQEMSAKHQGKVGGLLGFCAWQVMGQVHPLVGALVASNPNLRPYILAIFGLLPLVAFVVLALFWGKRTVTEGA